MSDIKQKLVALAMSAVLCISLAACGNTKTAGDSGSAETVSVTTAAADEMFTDRDYETDCSDFVTITLSDGATSAEGSGVTVDGNTVTITGEGTYRLTGTLTNGQIVVDAADTDKIQIVLDNVCVTSQGSAALYVKSADKVFLTMAEGAENTLASTGEFVQTDDNSVDGAIFAKSDLTMNGNGILTITSETGHGVVSKDDLKITSGTYVVTAAAQGLAGKDSVRIAAGTFTITAGKDGIHAENTEDTTKGFVYIADGTFTITADGDGISASGAETILDGTYDLTTGGGSANAAAKTGNDMGGGMGGMRGGGNVPTGDAPSGTPPTGGNGGTQPSAATTAASDTQVEATAMADTTTTTTADTASDDATSTKGLKAGGDLAIAGGTFTIDSADDAVHSNGNLTVSDGEFTITTGDDGFHADGANAISGGTVVITKSYEGIEGAAIVISGGTISLVASDDGLNAAGGNDGSGSAGGDVFSSGSSCSITISGGTITVDAGGDGIDSNGDLTVSGGATYVSGPTNSGNGALDYNGSASITGGVVIAVGATGMDQNFGSDSTQGSILYQLSASQAAGTVVTLKDSSGNVLASYTPTKQFQSVVVSAPGVASGSTYTLTVGSETETIEMTDLIYGTGSEMGGGMGGGPGGGHPAQGGQDATAGATVKPDTNQTGSNG